MKMKREKLSDTFDNDEETNTDSNELVLFEHDKLGAIECDRVRQ